MDKGSGLGPEGTERTEGTKGMEGTGEMRRTKGKEHSPFRSSTDTFPLALATLAPKDVRPSLV